MPTILFIDRYCALILPVCPRRSPDVFDDHAPQLLLQLVKSSSYEGIFLKSSGPLNNYMVEIFRSQVEYTNLLFWQATRHLIPEDTQFFSQFLRLIEGVNCSNEFFYALVSKRTRALCLTQVQ